MISKLTMINEGKALPIKSGVMLSIEESVVVEGKKSALVQKASKEKVPPKDVKAPAKIEKQKGIKTSSGKRLSAGKKISESVDSSEIATLVKALQDKGIRISNYTDSGKLVLDRDQLHATNESQLVRELHQYGYVAKVVGKNTIQVLGKVDESKRSAIRKMVESKRARKVNEARVGKTKEVIVLQGNYGYGWDDLVIYDVDQTKEARADKKKYDEEEKAPHRLIRRRVARETVKESKKLNEGASNFGSNDLINLCSPYVSTVVDDDVNDPYDEGYEVVLDLLNNIDTYNGSSIVDVKPGYYAGYYIDFPFAYNGVTNLGEALVDELDLAYYVETHSLTKEQAIEELNKTLNQLRDAFVECVNQGVLTQYATAYRLSNGEAGYSLTNNQKADEEAINQVIEKLRTEGTAYINTIEESKKVSGKALKEGYTDLSGNKVEVYSDYNRAKARAERLGLKEAEYGDEYGSDLSYCYWNKSGDRNDPEQVIAYYKFEDGRPVALTADERERVEKEKELTFENTHISGKALKEDIAVSEDDRKKALADYLDIDVSELEDRSDEYNNSHAYGISEYNDTYRVLTNAEAEEAAREYIISFFDEEGIKGFTPEFQDWIVENAIDESYLFEIQDESNRAYVADIISEDDDQYGSRLFAECISANIIKEDDLVRNEETGEVTLRDGLEQYELEDKYVDYLNNQEEALDYCLFNVGKEELSELAKEHPEIIDLDLVVEQCIAADGVGHFVATYDREEINLPIGTKMLYGYRIDIYI